MPIETPWIRTYDFPGEYTKGYGLGLEQAKANASMQMQANEMAQRAAMAQDALAQREQESIREAEIRKDIAQKNMLMEQARADITQAYNEAQLGIQRQRLQETARAMDFKIKEAAALTGAREEYAKRRAAYEASGMEPVMAGIRAGFEVPGFARHAGDVASLGGAQARLESLPADVPGGVTARPVPWEGAPGQFVPNAYMVPGRGGKSVIRSITGAPAAEASEFTALRDREIAINKILDSSLTMAIESADPDRETNEQKKKSLLEGKKRIQSLRDELEGIKRQRSEMRGQFVVPGSSSKPRAQYTWDPKSGKIVRVAQ